MKPACSWRRRMLTRVFRFTVAMSVVAAMTPAAAVEDPPLVRAARAGNAQDVQRLLQQRADVNATAVDGTTALHWAVRADDLAMADSLIRAGASVKASSRHGVTPLYL